MALRCEPLGLRLDVSFEPRPDCIRVTGDLADERGKDRPIVLVWAMPMRGAGMAWGDDLRHSRRIAEEGRYQKASAYGAAGRRGGHLPSL